MDNVWDNEPNEETFEHAGLPCRIIRNTSATGCLNGYVGIPAEHPLYGMGYNDFDINVHGGLNSARAGDGDRRAKGYWWFGFDTAHAGDLMPSLPVPSAHVTYKDINYVRTEVKSLAEQLMKAST